MYSYTHVMWIQQNLFKQEQMKCERKQDRSNYKVFLLLLWIIIF